MKNIKYKQGLVSVSFRPHSPKEIIEAMQGTELTCIEWGSDVHAPYTDLQKLEEIVALQKEYGITCSSYGTYFRLGITPIEELSGYVKAAKILGTDVLRLWCYNKKSSEMTDAERDMLVEQCCKAAEIAKENNVTMCLECHINTFTENPDDVIWLMNKINSPHFRMYWQPFQSQSVEENVISAKMLSTFVVNLHVFNWKGTERFPLAEAEEEWQSYLEQFEDEHTLLLEFMPEDTLDELKTEADALKKIIGG